MPFHPSSLWHHRQTGHNSETTNDMFQSAVFEDGEATGWFRMKAGVKQDCTLSVFFFFLSGYIFHYILKYTYLQKMCNCDRWEGTIPKIILFTRYHILLKKATRTDLFSFVAYYFK